MILPCPYCGEKCQSQIYARHTLLNYVFGFCCSNISCAASFIAELTIFACLRESLSPNPDCPPILHLKTAGGAWKDFKLASGKSRNRQNPLCPHCNTAVKIKKTDRISETCHVKYMVCPSSLCQFVFKAEIDITKLLSPPSIETCGVSLPRIDNPHHYVHTLRQIKFDGELRCKT